MPEKKKSNPLRVCIQFSSEDTCQLNAALLLNTKGRKKAAYVSQAIEFYEKKHELSGLSISELKNAVNDMIRESISSLNKIENTVATVTDDVKEKTFEQSFAVSAAPSADCNLPLDEINKEASKEVKSGEEDAMQSYISQVLKGFMSQ